MSFTIQYESGESRVIPSFDGYTMGALLDQICADVPALRECSDICHPPERIMFYDRHFRRVDGYYSGHQTIDEVFPDLFCRVMISNINLISLAHSSLQATATWPWVMDAEAEEYLEARLREEYLEARLREEEEARRREEEYLEACRREDEARGRE